MNIRNVIALAVSLALAFAAASLGSLATAPNIDGWYATLHKPEWTPPNAAFPIVWTILYAMMAIAAWRIWISDASARRIRTALLIYAAHLAVNVAWSFAFFAMQSPRLGLAVIAVLVIVIVWTIAAFWRIDRAAGLLLVPYMLWASFASALNLAIVGLNSPV